MVDNVFMCRLHVILHQLILLNRPEAPTIVISIPAMNKDMFSQFLPTHLSQMLLLDDAYDKTDARIPEVHGGPPVDNHPFHVQKITKPYHWA